MSSAARTDKKKRFVRKRHQLDSTGKMVPVEYPPVPLQLTEEDKEMFGEEIQKKLAEVKIDNQLSDVCLVPKPRKPDEIFEEDKEFASDYETIVVEDEDIHIEGLEDLVITQIDHWEDAGFDERLLANIKRAQYVKPRNVQKCAIPLILDNYDLRVQSSTGSGKTAAFALPIIDRIIYVKNTANCSAVNYAPYAVILAPTRELVNQCCEQISKFLEGVDEVKIGETYGEMNIHKGKQAIRHADIVCITPGRFHHFVGKRWIILDRLQFLVFDEADKLLGDGSFKRDINNVIDNVFVPKDCVTLFFSATFDPEIREVAKKYLRETDSAHITNNAMAPTKKCEQEFINTKTSTKFAELKTYFQNELQKAKTLPKTIVFCNHGDDCEKVSFALGEEICSKPISGMRSQEYREEIFQKFRDNEVPILVATDVCARGIDIKDVDLVINFDLPDADDYGTYVHRVGRCGRVRHGKSISYVDVRKDGKLLKKIHEAMLKDGVAIPASLQEVISAAEKQSTEDPEPKEADINVADF